MWLSTRNGLCRFDGYNFVTYTSEKDGLPFNDIERCVADPQGNLWLMGSFGKLANLAIFNPRTGKASTFKEKTGSDSNIHISFVRRMQDGTMHFGWPSEDHFFTWDTANGLKKVMYPFPSRKLMSSPETNTFWVVNFSGEMCELDLKGRVLRKIKVNFIPNVRHANMPYRGMYVTDSVTRKVMYISPEKTVTPATWLPPLEPVNADFIFNLGMDSLIWRQGKLFEKGGTVLRDFAKEGAPPLRGWLRDIYFDENDRIWMCTDFGLYLLTITKNKFKRYFYEAEENFKAPNSFRNILVTGNDLYASNEFTGIKHTNTVTGKSEIPPFKTPAPSLGFFVLKKISGDRLFGVNYHYLYLKEPGSKTWTFYRKPKTPDFLSCWDIRELGDERFLLGRNAGLEYLDLKRKTLSPFEKYNGYNDLKEGAILYMATDKNGEQWICGNSGFYRYDTANGILERYSAADTGRHFLPATEFHHYYEDIDGRFWFATASGLIMWNKQNGKYKLYTQNDGLSNNNVYAVYDDDLGNLWMSTDYGITRFNKRSQKPQTFLTSEGITHNEFNRLSHFKDDAGHIYFGSLNGVTGIDPKKFLRDDSSSNGAPLVVTSFKQFNGTTNGLEDKTTKLLSSRNIMLQPDDRFFTLNFALLTYTDVEYNTYYWRIDGIDAGWNSMKERALRLSRLPYGKHKLHIKAQAGDGAWSKNELEFNIITLKPYYLETWFIVLCGLGLLSLSAFWYKWRIWKLQRENVRLDWIVQEKTSALEEKVRDLKISSDQKNLLMKEIHHRVKNNLQVISVLLKLQLTNLQDAGARKSIEASISRVSSIALIHQYLYKGDDLTSIELPSFVTELFRQIGEVYQHESQEIFLKNEIPDILLDIDTAIPIGLILNELMVNSYKYSYRDGQNGTMQISLSHDNNGYLLLYCDNGPGMPEDFKIGKAGSLGMIIINSLAQQLQGKAEYRCDINSFCIHFKDTEMRKKTA